LGGASMMVRLCLMVAELYRRRIWAQKAWRWGCSCELEEWVRVARVSVQGRNE
jgi:hypothetical protein